LASAALTDAYLKSLKSSGGRTEVTDTKCSGLQLRVAGDGSKSFTLRYRMPGAKNPERVTLGSYPTISLTEAREMANDFRKDIARGKNPRAVRVDRATKSGMTFGEVAGQFLESYSRPGAWHHSRLKRPISEWAKLPIASITDDDVADLLNQMAENAPIAANRTRSALNLVFQWAMQSGRKYATSNPVSIVPKPAKEQIRRRNLNHEEIRILWRMLDGGDVGCDRSMALALKIILMTMARPGMVTGMQRSELFDLDGPTPEWRVPRERMKNGEEFVCPLSPTALALIKEGMSTGRDSVAVLSSRFRVRDSIGRTSLSQAVRYMLPKLKSVEQFTPHDLRRTAATIASEHGSEDHWVEAQLHHLRTGVAKVYNQYTMIKEKRQTVDILEKAILKIIGTAGQRT